MGHLRIIEKGQIFLKYNESEASEYMKNYNIDITIDIGTGFKEFIAYTMDLSKKYIEINSDYRS